MAYIYQILGVILIGISVGTLLGPRSGILLIGTVIALVLGIATIITANWMPLLAGAIVFFIAHATQRDAPVSA